MEHELKTWPEHFDQVWEGTKRFEVRKDDRGFQVGDTLRLREWSGSMWKGKDGYSGRGVVATVVCKLSRFDGLKAGYCVLGIHLRLRVRYSDSVCVIETA